MRGNKSILMFLLGVAGLAASCGKPEVGQAGKNPTAEPSSARTPVVKTVQAETRPVLASVQTTGSFVARESSDVAPPTAGRVAETPIDVGDFVQTGQIIAKLEDRDAKLRLDQAMASEQQEQAAYDSAVAEAKLSKAEAQRYASLIKTGDVSESAYEKALTQTDTAAAQVNSARQQYLGMQAQGSLARKAIEDTLIRAPFTGYISARPIAVGQYVALTSKIATVLRITPIRLELQVAQADAPQIRVSAVVQAVVSGFPGLIFPGKVTAINPAVDSNSREFTVIAEFPNNDHILKPGMFATARILLPASSQGIFVPRQAVLMDATTNSAQLFFIRDGKARVAVVQLGASEGEEVQILSGISADMKIAADHLQDLYDGQSVKIAGTGQ